MILLTVDEIIDIHKKVVGATGGSSELRDRGLLESAVYSAEASFGDMEQYPTIEEKAAQLAYGLIGNHAFVDGNKRIGVIVMLLTLELNNVRMAHSQADLIDLGLGAASGELQYDDILSWIRTHRK